MLNVLEPESLIHNYQLKFNIFSIPNWFFKFYLFKISTSIVILFAHVKTTKTGLLRKNRFPEKKLDISCNWSVLFCLWNWKLLLLWCKNISKTFNNRSIENNLVNNRVVWLIEKVFYQNDLAKIGRRWKVFVDKLCYFNRYK